MADATLPKRTGEHRSAIVENIEWMLDTRRGVHEIACRIGLPELHRWGRHDLAHPFERVAATR